MVPLFISINSCQSHFAPESKLIYVESTFKARPLHCYTSKQLHFAQVDHVDVEEGTSQQNILFSWRTLLLSYCPKFYSLILKSLPLRCVNSFPCIFDILATNEAAWAMLNETLALLEEQEREYIFDRLYIRVIFIALYSLVFCFCFFGKLVSLIHLGAL